MKRTDLDCMFHDEGIPDAPCICDGAPPFGSHPIVRGEVIPACFCSGHTLGGGFAHLVPCCTRKVTYLQSTEDTEE